MSVATDAAATDVALMTHEDVEIEEEGEGGMQDAMWELTSGRLSMNGRIGAGSPAVGLDGGLGGIGRAGNSQGASDIKQSKWGLLRGLMTGGGRGNSTHPAARDAVGGVATVVQAVQQQRMKKRGLVVGDTAMSMSGTFITTSILLCGFTQTLWHLIF
jgi:hypothetical protein